MILSQLLCTPSLYIFFSNRKSSYRKVPSGLSLQVVYEIVLHKKNTSFTIMISVLAGFYFLSIYIASYRKHLLNGVIYGFSPIQEGQSCYI